MMKYITLSRVAGFGITIAAAAIAGLGPRVDMTSQLEAIRSLTVVASVIFGLLGAWAIVVEPRARKVKGMSDIADLTRMVELLDRIVPPLLLTAFVLSGALFAQVCAPAFQAIGLSEVYETVVLRVSYGVVVASALTLVLSVLVATVPFIDFYLQLDADRVKLESRRRHAPKKPRQQHPSSDDSW